jgi:hypothetical protein
MAALGSYIENRRTDLPMHAVSHMVWNDSPHAHQGQRTADELIGIALHYSSSVFWAGFFEMLFGRQAERSSAAALAGGMSTAAAAYVTDYEVVPERFNPGFHAHLSGSSVFLLYAALGLGLAAGARLRGLHDHEIEDRHEGDERRDSERGPDRVIAPE